MDQVSAAASWLENNTTNLGTAIARVCVAPGGAGPPRQSEAEVEKTLAESAGCRPERRASQQRGCADVEGRGKNSEAETSLEALSLS